MGHNPATTRVARCFAIVRTMVLQDLLVCDPRTVPVTGPGNGTWYLVPGEVRGSKVSTLVLFKELL